MSSEEPTLSSSIPTGSWTLYFHAPDETKWTLQTFMNLGSIKTWQQFWSLMDALNTDCFTEGMFFMMRDPAPPLWESHHHIRGGCYSFRSPKREAAKAYLDYMIASLLGTSVLSADNKTNGITISPKRGFNIIKIWNTDSQAFHAPADLNHPLGRLREGDVIYTPFVKKKM